MKKFRPRGNFVGSEKRGQSATKLEVEGVIYMTREPRLLGIMEVHISFSLSCTNYKKKKRKEAKEGIR